MNGPFADGLNAVWTCPVKALKTDWLFATLVELIGCPNEGWARNAYFGLLDLIQHGDEQQIADGLKTNGINGFRKLFSSYLHYSNTWDGFAAGLDIFERLISFTPASRKLCIAGLSQLLGPVKKTYKQREKRIKCGIPEEDLGGLSVCSIHPRRTNAPCLYQSNKASTFFNEMTIGKIFHGISKLPFASNFDTWLRRIETIVAVNCGVQSNEYCYTVTQIKLWCPTYDGLKLNYGRLSTQNALVNKLHKKKANQKHEPYHKFKSVTDAQLLNPPSTRLNLLGPFACMSGPPAEQCGHFNFPLNQKSDMDIPKRKSLDLVKLRTDQYSNDVSLEQSRSSWLQKRAASLVQRVLTRMDLSYTTKSNGSAEEEAIGERVSSTTQDISSIYMLSNRVDHWTSHTIDSNTEKIAYPRSPPGEQTESPSEQLKLKHQKVKVEKSNVENTTVFENLECNSTYEEPSERLKEDTSEHGSVNQQSKLQNKLDQLSGKESLSMLVNRSEVSGNYLYGLGTVRIQGSLPNEQNSDLTEINDYYFTVVDSSMIVTPTDDEETRKKREQYKTAVEWRPPKKTEHNVSKLTGDPDIFKLDALVNMGMVDLSLNKVSSTVLDSITSPSMRESRTVNKKIFPNQLGGQNDLSNQSFSQTKGLAEFPDCFSKEGILDGEISDLAQAPDFGNTDDSTSSEEFTMEQSEPKDITKSEPRQSLSQATENRETNNEEQRLSKDENENQLENLNEHTKINSKQTGMKDLGKQRTSMESYEIKRSLDTTEKRQFQKSVQQLQQHVRQRQHQKQQTEQEQRQGQEEHLQHQSQQRESGEREHHKQQHNQRQQHRQRQQDHRSQQQQQQQHSPETANSQEQPADDDEQEGENWQELPMEVYYRHEKRKSEVKHARNGKQTGKAMHQLNDELVTGYKTIHSLLHLEKDSDSSFEYDGGKQQVKSAREHTTDKKIWSNQTGLTNLGQLQIGAKVPEQHRTVPAGSFPNDSTSPTNRLTMGQKTENIQSQHPSINRPSSSEILDQVITSLPANVHQGQSNSQQSLKRKSVERIFHTRGSLFRARGEASISPQIELPDMEARTQPAGVKVPTDLKGSTIVKGSKPWASTDACVGPGLDAFQTIRLHVNLQVHASWDEDAIPCPIMIDTQVTVTPPPLGTTADSGTDVDTELNVMELHSYSASSPGAAQRTNPTNTPGQQ
ncbi:uncharacterized protein DEA37_0003443 [Paragonimus westermani]|uniref:Uncharacterized protein n=1 Tax=Paragonimus westermani TaxID=34504 RepID=A0A5J4NI31_9TREM|nr:uncharacterized protein DEA37_0003443 [Paragonimus westermani]